MLLTCSATWNAKLILWSSDRSEWIHSMKFDRETKSSVISSGKNDWMYFTYGDVAPAQETLEHPEQSEERVCDELDYRITSSSSSQYQSA